jgi:hypothetical protein
MKKFIILLALLSVLGGPAICTAAPLTPICGRIVRRIAPPEPRGFWRYDVLVGRQILRWSSPAKLGLGTQMCV